jgi:hypothetical protein
LFAASTHTRQREKANVKESINSINLTSFYPSMSEDALIKELVSQFLRHDGYVETAKAFAEEVRREASTLKSDSLSRIDSHNVQEDIDATNRQSKASKYSIWFNMLTAKKFELQFWMAISTRH